MKLRKAIKIWKKIDKMFDRKGKFLHLKWKRSTVKSAHIRCNRAYLDERVHYMESEEELEQKDDMMFCVFADILSDNEEDAQKWKDRYFKGEFDDLPTS